MLPTLLASIALCIACLIAALIGVDRPRISFWVVLGLAFAFPFLAHADDWNWFDWAKRYTIVVSALTLAWIYRRATLRPDLHAQTLRLARVLLMAIVLLNLAEVALFDLSVGNTFNGVLLCIVTVLVPTRWTYNETGTVVSFRDPWWAIAATVCFGYTYFFNDGFLDSALPVQIVLVTSMLGAALKRGWFYWGPHRLFNLLVLVIGDSVYPPLFSRYLYPPAFHPESRLSFLGTPVEVAWLVVGSVAVTMLVVTRRRAAAMEPRPLLDRSVDETVVSPVEQRPAPSGATGLRLRGQPHGVSGTQYGRA